MRVALRLVRVSSRVTADAVGLLADAVALEACVSALAAGSPPFGGDVGVFVGVRVSCPACAG